MSTGTGELPHDAVVWTPETSGRRWRIEDFAEFAATRGGPPPGGYHPLWVWSIMEPERFWAVLAEYFDLPLARWPGAVLDDSAMPGAVWFPGAVLNYTEQVLRRSRSGTAITGRDESGRVIELSWAELARQTAAFAAALRAHGVRAGDLVAGYLPDLPETVIAFLATASLGAVWACCGQDLAPNAVIDRFHQLEPVVLVSAGGYHHRGGFVDRIAETRAVVAGLPSVRLTVVVPRPGHPVPDDFTTWVAATAGEHHLEPVPVGFEHPLWVLFSSGTTGLPKGIVHGHGGVVIEHLKTIALHLEAGPGDTFFWYTTPTWMMWNLKASALLTGAAIICFDGAPTGDSLWTIAAEHNVTTLGVSPGYLVAARKSGQRPAAEHELGALRMLGCTGSVLAPGLHAWIAADLGPGVLVNSISGGTDVVTGFACCVPTEPGRAGELSAPCLGVDLEVWNDAGEPVVDEVGDLVVRAPMPSMPVAFWADPDGEKYRTAYFADHPGVWRHGDWITLTSRGSVVVHGRSDATLNRNGIRMGSGDIYHVVEALPEVQEALVVGVERPDGGYWMPLFVVLADGVVLDDALTAHIRGVIRTQLSPRHVPDEIIAAPGIPHTRTGKKIEVPIKRILSGRPGAPSTSVRWTSRTCCPDTVPTLPDLP